MEIVTTLCYNKNKEIISVILSNKVSHSRKINIEEQICPEIKSNVDMYVNFLFLYYQTTFLQQNPAQYDADFQILSINRRRCIAFLPDQYIDTNFEKTKLFILFIIVQITNYVIAIELKMNIPIQMINFNRMKNGNEIIILLKIQLKNKVYLQLMEHQ